MEAKEIVVASVAMPDEQHLTEEVSAIELQAKAITVTNDVEYEEAAQFGRLIKDKTAAVTDFFKPLKDAAHKAHKAICDREKSTLAPLQKAEATVKKTMGDYVMEQERKRREQEEALKRAAAAERERLLAEAAEKEKAGDAEGAEAAVTEAIVMDEATLYQAAAIAKPQATGVTTSKDWEIVEVRESEVPVSTMGIIIRPVDQGAIMRLIRASKGTVQIPGVVYKEVAKMSFRRR